MGRIRELIMEIEVVGRFFENIIDRLLLSPPTFAKPIVHFRRHSKWKDYMEGTVDGTTASSNDDLCYGFDWLGDEHYDFGKTNVLTERRGRYNFIHDTVFNSINDPDTNNPGSKTTIIMEDKNIDSSETLAAKITNYKTVFQQGAKLSTVHGKEYFPSWINIRQSNEAKLRLGLRNDIPAVAQFGDNDDTIHLIAEPGYENHFIITPNEIKKADFIFGEIEISFTCHTGVHRDVSIMAYHTDINSARSANGTLDPAQDGVEVGELRVMKNDEIHTLDFVLVKVQRTGGTDFATPALGPLTTQADAEKRIGRAYEQALIECNFSLLLLPNCLDATDARFNRANGTYNHKKYIKYINNNFLYDEYKTSVGAASAVSFTDFESDSRSVRSSFTGTNQKRFILFIHDYRNTSRNVNGSADSTEETHFADKGKWAVIYNNGSASFDTAIHEAAHTMGLHHTFNSYTTKTASYRNTTVSPSWVRANILPSGNKALYFAERELHAKHLYRQGKTENVMDYKWFAKFDSNDKVDFLTIAPPTGTSYNDIAANRIHYGARTKNRYYKIPTTSSGRMLRESNPNTRISFYKWHWSILQLDDEVVERPLALTVPISPTINIVPPPPVIISAPPPNIAKS